MSIYGPRNTARSLASLEYAYRHGATHFWFWGGWPNIDSDWPHFYKLFMINQLQDIAKRCGPRDMNKLLHLAKVAIALPYGYEMGFNGMIIDTNWLHPERKNKHGSKIRDVLHSAYIETERLLRDGVEFDVVIDHRLDKEGYDEIIFIQEDGKVRPERGSEVELLDGPRVPQRPELGPRPKITAQLVKRPKYVGDEAALDIKVEIGSSDVAWRSSHYFGEDSEWQFARWRLFRPDGLQRSGSVTVQESNATKTLLIGRSKSEKLYVPGTYRLQVSTIDEFSHWAETWLEFDVKAKFLDSPVSRLPENWRFHLDRKKVGESQKWYASDLNDADWVDIKVPSWWEDVGYEDYDGMAWYRCDFHVPAVAKGKKLILAFEAVDGDVTVYVNGKEIGHHDGDNERYWDEPFEFDVSNVLNYGADNQLTVRVLATQAMGGIFKTVRLVIRQPARSTDP